MSGNDGVPEVTVGLAIGPNEEFYTRLRQLHPHNDGKRCTNKASDNGEHEVQRTNVLVVR